MRRQQLVCKYIEEKMERFIEISEFIHQHPEVAYKEKKASSLLIKELQQNGFEVDVGVADLSTAFKAVKHGNDQGPNIALICEYDALPELGHACGHNIIATISLAAGLAIAQGIDDLAGSIMVIGTPAEEHYAGKVQMIEQGIFEDVGCAMMFHPFSQTMVDDIALANIHVKMKFYGKESHAAAFPHEGINALDGLIQTFNNINGLRGHLKDDVRIHGIITEGGVATNIVPKYAEAEFSVRAARNSELNGVLEKVVRCGKAGALSSGCTVNFEYRDVRYKEVITNQALAKRVKENLTALGEKVCPCTMDCGVASTDMGNLTHVVPGIHGHIGLGKELHLHTEKLEQAAMGEKANRCIEVGAKALAMTAIDLLENPKLYQQVQQEFKQEIDEQNRMKQR